MSESKIMYIESIGDKTAIHTDGYGTLVSGRTLREWSADLDPIRFVRPHRTFIVNFDYVESIEGGMAALASGANIPVSARSAKAVKENMREYVRKRSR